MEKLTLMNKLPSLLTRLMTILLREPTMVQPMAKMTPTYFGPDCTVWWVSLSSLPTVSFLGKMKGG